MYLQVHQPGLVIHTVGYPLDNSTYGGAWIYHMDNRCVLANDCGIHGLHRVPVGGRGCDIECFASL